MNVLTKDGVMHELHQASLYSVSVEVVVAALSNVVHASVYCMPCRAWFLHDQFPRLKSPSSCAVPALRLMQRLLPPEQYLQVYMGQNQVHL